jgi:hypothetical protein
MSAPRVLLMRLSIRESAKGRPYLSGYLGAARVVAFKATERDKFGNEQWEVFVAAPEPKAGAPRQEILPPERPTRGQGTWNAARDLPVGETAVHKNERRDPRQERIDSLARAFDERPPDEVP